MDVRVWLCGRLSTKELILLNCGVGEDTWGPLDCKEIQPVHPKGNQSWILIGRTDGEAENSILWPPDVKSWLIWKDPDAGKDWRRGKGDDKGWDDWMASLTQWTWVWVSSRSWCWSEKPGVLQSMGSQRQTWLSNLTELTEFFESILRRQLALLRSLRYYHTSSIRLRIYIIMVNKGFPDSSACNEGDPSWIPGWVRSAREGIGYPFQYSWASLVAPW